MQQQRQEVAFLVPTNVGMTTTTTTTTKTATLHHDHNKGEGMGKSGTQSPTETTDRTQEEDSVEVHMTSGRNHGNIPSVQTSNNSTESHHHRSDDDNDDDGNDNRNSHNTSASHSSHSKAAPDLRGKLTRTHKDRDPFSIYERVKVLGNGSMGNVTLVRKVTVGGSARYNATARAAVQAHYDACFQMPILGNFFAWILKGKAERDLLQASRQPFVPIHPDKNDSGGSSSSNKSITTATAATANLSSSAETNNNNTNTINQPLFAMKSIHYKLIQDQTFIDELRNEISMLKTLDHPHIVRVHETFDYGRQLFVVMEVCTGGDLYARDPYTEPQAARIVAAVLSAVSFMHAHNIIHRDLKYENILFVNEMPTAEIKLIDFGLCKEIKEHEHIQEGAGTIYTMAPEVIKGEYSKEADLWSVGVIVFMLLSSQMPFYGRKRRDIAKKILAGEYEYKGRRWQSISDHAKAFLEELLVLDPDKRATASEALASSWLHRRREASVRKPYRRELTHVTQCIERYVKYPRLRKLALMLIAHRSTSVEIGILRKVFQLYDTHNNGHLTYEAFKGALQEVGYSDENYHEIFDAVDVDGSGSIRYTEFLAATIEATGWISEERLAEAFDRVDHDDTGYITKDNLRYLFGNEFPEDELDSIMSESASDDGKGISYADFLSQWNDNKEEYMKRWRDHMVPDEVTEKDDNDTPFYERTDMVSELSFDGSCGPDDHGRSDFVRAKAVSERKRRDANNVPTETK